MRVAKIAVRSCVSEASSLRPFLSAGARVEACTTHRGDNEKLFSRWRTDGAPCMCGQFPLALRSSGPIYMIMGTGNT
jgi:hypothetical protein